MTGTSMDGIDAVCVSIHGQGLQMTATFEAIASVELGELTSKLRHLASGIGSTTEMDSAATELGLLTVEAIQELHLDSIDLIALHGQTIFHKPPASIQLIDPVPVLEAYQCTILTDPRKADLEYGGQGAPITPLADWVMFRSRKVSNSIVNLGGFCNLTILPADSEPDSIRGFDVCCCNLLLDAIARRCLDESYDHCGREALQGSLNTDVYSQLFNELELQRTGYRSLGSEDDLGEFAIGIGQHLSPADLLASATSAIGSCITNALQGAGRVYLAGGGVHNVALANAIQHDGTTNDLGVPSQAREAMAMAILGALAQDGESITLSNITGRKETDDPIGWVYARP